MPARITAIDPNQAAGKTADLFDAIKAKLGLVPNLMRTLGHSPAALEAYLGFSETLSRGALSARAGEQVALAVAQANECDYCLAAHSLLGAGAGLSASDIQDARQANASDKKTAALLSFATSVVDTRGRAGDEVLAAVRAAGASDAEIIETVAHVALNILTNYVNHVAETVIDFPPAAPLAKAK